MKPATRAALKLPASATDADGAAALARGEHNLTIRDLDMSDPEFLMYLKKQQFLLYSDLYKAHYGVAPAAPTISKVAPTATPTPEANRQAKVKLAALGTDVTFRQLDREHPSLMLELRQNAPEEYSRLYLAHYGKVPAGMPEPGAAQKQADAEFKQALRNLFNR